MRNISTNGLTTLAKRTGNEPIIIIEVDWGDGPISYADRDLPGIHGRILEVGQLDNVIDVSGSNSSQELSVVLDDTDGAIKAIFDSHDVHQRPARVYQFFAGLDLADKFLLFAGKVSSPITWSEADRTFSFSIISQLEDKEIGFSAEEGEFPFIPKDMVGKAWPIIFGRVFDVPALQVNHAVSGTTLSGVGIISGADLHEQVPLGGNDCGTGMSLAQMQEQATLASLAASAWTGLDPLQASYYLETYNNLNAQISQTAAGHQAQQNCALAQRKATIAQAKDNGEGDNPIRILGGEDFPQNRPIKLNINGGLFTGSMHGDKFAVTKRQHPENEALAREAFQGIEQCPQPTPPQVFDISANVPPGFGDGGSDIIRRNGFIICNQLSTSQPNVDEVAQRFWAEPGSRVVLASDEPITYIVSITPGTVLAVKAYKNFDQQRKLVNVPNNLWRVETKTYGDITAIQVVTTKPLSTIVDQGWEDDLYVTFQSTIGPNVVDILEYIIDRWTDLDFDTTSFNAVKAKVENFPANFPILDRRNTIEVLREIAFQARCAIWINNGVFYLKYLPEEPAADATIAVSDVASGSIEVGMTATEDLVTKMVVTWRYSWATDKPEKFILRNNVPKYGTKEQEFDFYIYSQADVAYHAASFWLIRKSNTWKRVKFKSFLNKLNLETFDTADLQIANIANVKAVVEDATYDSESNTIQFECWLPIIAGTNEQFAFAWPAAVTAEWPPSGQQAGGGTNATGVLPIGNTSGIELTGTVFVGGPNVVFRGRSDRGTRRPGDTGFTPYQQASISVFGEVRVQGVPRDKLRLNYVQPQQPPQVPAMIAQQTVIDIQKTKIVDSADPGAEARLASVLPGIRNAALYLGVDAQYGDGATIATFDFRFDGDNDKYGAGTAFLKD